MPRRIARALLPAIAALLCTGCTLCQNPDDATYAYFGGLIPRANPTCGRVGSAFDDASGGISGAVVSEEVVEEQYAPELDDERHDH